MPWQEVCVQEERIRFIHDWQQATRFDGRVVRRYGISRRVGYKWLARYKQEGIEGVQDRPRAPKQHPNQTAAAIEERILALRAEHGRWGPTTLKAVLERKDATVKWPARSTIGNLLRPPRTERAPPAAAAGGSDSAAADPDAGTQPSVVD